MKITILGSVAFRKEQLNMKNKLKELGHVGIISPVMEELALGKNKELLARIEKDHSKAKKEGGYIKWYYDSIVASDAVLVLNLNKNGQENYIGGNVLMEIGFAHVRDKKIYLYNPVPEYSPYIDEIKAMYDEIINGDLTKIK
jgi:hypothetical protein